jgi:hypothetical protein
MRVHVPSMLQTGTLLDGSSWFSEALNKTWKQALLHHTDYGGGKRGQPKPAGKGTSTAVATDDDSPSVDLSGDLEVGLGVIQPTADQQAKAPTAKSLHIPHPGSERHQDGLASNSSRTSGHR